MHLTFKSCHIFQIQQYILYIPHYSFDIAATNSPDVYSIITLLDSVETAPQQHSAVETTVTSTGNHYSNDMAILINR